MSTVIGTCGAKFRTANFHIYKECFPMAELKITLERELLRRAEKLAATNGTTVEALIREHLTDRVGRRRTVREQIYRDYEPPCRGC